MLTGDGKYMYNDILHVDWYYEDHFLIHIRSQGYKIITSKFLKHCLLTDTPDTKTSLGLPLTK